MRRSDGCDSGRRGFESHQPPKIQLTAEAVATLTRRDGSTAKSFATRSDYVPTLKRFDHKNRREAIVQIKRWNVIFCEVVYARLVDRAV